MVRVPSPNFSVERMAAGRASWENRAPGVGHHRSPRRYGLSHDSIMFFVFWFCASILVMWVLLMVSGWLSIRWSRRSPERRSALRLALAVVPVLVGLFLFRFHLRWTMNDVTMNLSWPFVIPISVGVFAIISWFRARRSQTNA